MKSKKINDNNIWENKNNALKYLRVNQTNLNIKLHKICLTLIILIIISLIFLIIFYQTKISQLIKLFSLDPFPIPIEIRFKEIEKYIRLNLEGNLTHYKFLFYKRNNPKISIVISTFNGEIYLKPVVRSIQNQNFLDIEIIIVDDGSIDNSVRVVKELMEEDSRIKLLTNGINRGTLYTKTKGVLNSKGKYVMTLDHDNFFATNYVFSKLYSEAEINNLDLLGFAAITTPVEIKNVTPQFFSNYHQTPIIKKPNIKRRFLGFIESEQSSTSLCLYFIKKDLFLNVIKQLGDEFINRNIDAHDDTILIFVLSRNALSLKHLEDIFYIILLWPKEYSKSLEFHDNVKVRERENKSCFSYLTFTEVLLLFTENNKSDKYIAEINFLNWFIRMKKCNNQKNIMNDTIRVCNLYLKNLYISSEAKKEIYLYLNKTKQTIGN